MATRSEPCPTPCCRLCMWADVQLCEIFGPFGLQRRIPEKIKEVFPFKVEKNDGLPNYICTVCMYKLELLHDFLLGSVIIDTTLRERYCLPNDLLESYELQGENYAKPIENVSMKEGPNDSLSVTGTEVNASVCNEVFDLQENINNMSTEESPKGTSTLLGHPSNLLYNDSAARNNSLTQDLKSSKDLVKNNGHKPVAGNKKFSCKRCSVMFKTRNQALLHYCNSPTLFHNTCRYCGRQFKSKAALKRHKKKHINIALFRCGKCECTFESWRARRIHLHSECSARSQLGESHPTYTCDVCHMEFTSIRERSRHRAGREHTIKSIEHKKKLFELAQASKLSHEVENCEPTFSGTDTMKVSITEQDNDNVEHIETGSLKQDSNYCQVKRVCYKTYSDGMWFLS